MSQILLFTRHSQDHLIWPGRHSVWAVTDSRERFANTDAAVKMDLDYDEHGEQIPATDGQMVLAQSIFTTLENLPAHYSRLNAWPGFAAQGKMECCLRPDHQPQATEALQQLGLEPLPVPDVEGMIAPRMVAGIFYEATLALNDGLATEEDINKAMKLGTNYPHGPFEWMEMLGKARTNLLIELAVRLAATPAHG